MNPILIALIVSAAANVFLGWEYLHQRDATTVAKIENKQVTTVATACSKGTEALATKAAQNAASAAPARAQAQKRADEANARADTILAKPAAVPGDACKSAEALVDDWWTGRAKP